MSRHAFTTVQFKNATAVRTAQRAYSQQWGHRCEKCNRDSFGRRTRLDGMLVCYRCKPPKGMKPCGK